MRVSYLFAVLASAYAAIIADEVKQLPGWSPKPLLSKMYSGYLAVGGEKYLHYIYVASQSKTAATDPVVLWMNGGPGCSSLDGFLYEQGPYYVADDGVYKTLYANNYSWNLVSNMIFLEAPAGVGFSYTDDPAGLVHNDSSTAADNLAAVLAFFEGFPELRSNPFWVTGESYAGIYVPTLSYAIYESNEAGLNPKINIVGAMVGNGCLGNDVGTCGFGVDPRSNGDDIWQWKGHGLISSATADAADAACNHFVGPASNECNQAMNDASAEVGHINIYWIYGPCRNTGPSPLETAPFYQMSPKLTRYRRLGGPDACFDTIQAYTWLNDPVTKAQLHVAPGLTWILCSGNLTYSRTQADERQEVYPTLIEKAKLRVLIYNGEADACVPVTDNEWWTTSMNYTLKQGTRRWQAWMTDSEDVGGYVTQYSPPGGSFTFTTIRGAGHMVPEDAPKAALKMFVTQLTGGTWEA